MALRRVFYAIINDDEVRAFYYAAERDDFVAECTGTNLSVRAVTLREIKQTFRANLPGGCRRFRLPSGEWIERQIKT